MAALSLAACAPVTVQTFTDRGTEFSGYRTYEWRLGGSEYTGDPRLDSNPIFHGSVIAAIEEQLGARGFERDAAAPDLLVRYFVSTTQRIYVAEDGRPGVCADCRTEVFDEGTLVIDFVDARTNRLIWRGWAEGSIDGVIEDQAAMERRIHEAAGRILQRLPPRAGRPVPLT